jgi:hypothetical protein
MKELENKHNQEIIRLEKSFKLQCKSSLTQPPCLSPAPKPVPASFKAKIDRIHSIFTSDTITKDPPHFFSRRMLMLLVWRTKSLRLSSTSSSCLLSSSSCGFSFSFTVFTKRFSKQALARSAASIS